MKASAQAELVKLHAKLGLAAPSSLLQEGSSEEAHLAARKGIQRDAFNDMHQVQNGIEALQGKLHSNIDSFMQEMKTGSFPAPPSSLLEEGERPESLRGIHEDLEAMKASAEAELVKLHAKLGLAAPSSLLQEGASDTLEEDEVTQGGQSLLSMGESNFARTD